MSFDYMARDEERQEWFTPAEAARYLRVTRQTIYRYMEQGLLTYYVLKSGGGRRLRRSDLDALLEQPSSSEGPSSSF
jgi:excisionase family DNA binding protein